MNIAVITGASSGLGEKYALEIMKSRPDVEQIWIIARRKEKLDLLAKKLGDKARVLALDITDKTALKEYVTALNNANATVTLLINNAGFGRLGNFYELAPEDNADMVTLNCEALTYFTAITLPFMRAGGEILNSCSIASFAPNARMAVYSSTKAYVLSFSKALRMELGPKKINVIAVCPGPMETEFLSLAGITKGKSRTFDTLPRVKPEVMAKKSLIASKKGKAVYTNLLFYKFYRILAKLLPHSFVMKMCAT